MLSIRLFYLRGIRSSLKSPEDAVKYLSHGVGSPETRWVMVTEFSTTSQPSDLGFSHCVEVDHETFQWGVTEVTKGHSLSWSKQVIKNTSAPRYSLLTGSRHIIKVLWVFLMFVSFYVVWMEGGAARTNREEEEEEEEEKKKKRRRRWGRRTTLKTLLIILLWEHYNHFSDERSSDSDLN